MVDRRKLIIGGGAVAATAALAVVTGRAASAAEPRPLSTAAHARLVLESVDAERGLVTPVGFQEAFESACPPYPPEPVNPKADTLDAWARRRLVDLCGTDSFVDAWASSPQPRTLVGFFVVAFSQRQRPDRPLSPVTGDTPLTDTLRDLEPDFLPVLHAQIAAKVERSPAFAEAVGAGGREFDRVVADHVRAVTGSGGTAQATNTSPSNTDVLVFSAAVALFFLLNDTARALLKSD